jgi:hypothetical protein
MSATAARNKALPNMCSHRSERMFRVKDAAGAADRAARSS